MLVATFVRRLRSGLTYADFRDAWYPEAGFGVPTRVLNGVRVDDPTEILSVGFVDAGTADLSSLLQRSAAAEAARHDHIERVVASTPLRAVYELVDDQDFTSAPRPTGGATPGAGITPSA